MTTEEYIEHEALQKRNAAAAIRAASKIAIACHVNPDGDALGSMLGLGLAIEAGFPDKQVTFFAQDGVPFVYKFLPGSDRVITESAPIDIDLSIVVDSGDIVRVGQNILPIISSAPVVLDIDHHVGEGAFGAVRLLDNRAAATAEIVFDLLCELQLPIDRDIAMQPHEKASVRVVCDFGASPIGHHLLFVLLCEHHIHPLRREDVSHVVCDDPVKVIFGQLPDNRAGRYLARVSRIDADDGGRCRVRVRGGGERKNCGDDGRKCVTCHICHCTSDSLTVVTGGGDSQPKLRG